MYPCMIIAFSMCEGGGGGLLSLCSFFFFLARCSGILLSVGVFFGGGGFMTEGRVAALLFQGGGTACFPFDLVPCGIYAK